MRQLLLYCRTWGQGNQVSSISKFFNQNGINLVTFDRNERKCKGFACFKVVGQRSKSGQLIYAENNQETAMEHILKNEITSVLNFIQTVIGKMKVNASYHWGEFWKLVDISSNVKSNSQRQCKGCCISFTVCCPHKSSGKYAKE